MLVYIVLYCVLLYHLSSTFPVFAQVSINLYLDILCSPWARSAPGCHTIPRVLPQIPFVLPKVASITIRCTQFGIQFSKEILRRFALVSCTCRIHSNSSCKAPRLGRCIRIYLKKCFLGCRVKPLCSSPIAAGHVRAVKNGRALSQ